MNIGTWLSGIGILGTLIGSWLVAYEVVNKFTGASYSTSNGWGGIGGSTNKTEVFIQWEDRRNFFMWIGLAFITVGSLLQLVGLCCSSGCASH